MLTHRQIAVMTGAYPQQELDPCDIGSVSTEGDLAYLIYEYSGPLTVRDSQNYRTGDVPREYGSCAYEKEPFETAQVAEFRRIAQHDRPPVMRQV